MSGKNSVDAGFFVELRPQTTANLPIPEQELQILARHFRYFKFPSALNTLFRFYYGTNSQKREALSQFQRRKSIDMHDDIHHNSYEFTNILEYTDQQFRVLADELLYQYKAYRPQFLDIYSIKKINNCNADLQEIEEKMASHPVLLFRVVEHCANAHKNDTLVSQCVVLLLLKNPASQTTALEKLGFDFEYRILLKPYARDIASLLLAMHKKHIQDQKLLTIQDNLAILDLLKQIKSVEQIELDSNNDSWGEIEFFENEVLNFIKHSSAVAPNTPSFAEYQKLLENLGKATLAWINSKLRLSKIGGVVTQSNSEFSGQKNTGILFAAVTNMPLAAKFSKAELDCNRTRTEYNSALKDLKDFLELHKR